MPDTQAYGDTGWLTIREAADLLNVHPETLRRWDRTGRLTTSRTPTGHRRYRRADLDALMAEAERRTA